MMCWFWHKWGKWKAPIRADMLDGSVGLIQLRHCQRCDATEARRVI